MAGGLDLNQERIKSTELYDLKTERWRSVGDLPKSLSNHRATTINNTVLIFGTYVFHTFSASSTHTTPIALQEDWKGMINMRTQS